ncbi:uncharacterized protein JCM6883_002328 [Sporobolomyces salmoneus]|uniref:uncharacterized protein n=1 Tax=Sporobolomyces salmoneus TaxID=183962 RepID=UPI00317F337E
MTTRTREEIVQSLRSEGYGYRDCDEFERARARDYPALKDEVYLDYAASPPAPVTPAQRFATTLASTLYANPHSASTSGSETSLLIAKTRTRVLTELFNVSSDDLDKWDVVFTQGGATRGIQMIGDAWNWKRTEEMDNGQIALRYLTESHTSLVGLRGIALSRSASVESHSTPSSLLRAASRQTLNSRQPTLYTYPAQCNATGGRLGLDFAKKIKRADANGVVLVDAAAYCATKVLDLGSVSENEAPDAIVGSFYKIFGWPTSLGFFVIRRAASHHFLSTPHFGGGSISSLSLSAPFTFTPRASPTCSNPTIHQRLEQGTVPYLEIVALSQAMDWFKETYGGLNEVELHVRSSRNLAQKLLSELRHEGGETEEGEPVFIEHQAFQPLPADSANSIDPELDVELESPGPTIGFSLFSPPSPAPDTDLNDFRQTHVGTAHLSRLAIVNGISLRTGGLCNAGVWTRVFGVDDDELRALEAAGRACWDDQEYSPFYPHRPLGISRISFGAASTVDDVLKFVEFVKRFFVYTKEVIQLGKTERKGREVGEEVRRARLGTLLLYPIKSCAAQSVDSERDPEGWPLTSTGLLYDREFMLVDPSSGKALSQKKYPRMALIKPAIDLERGTLTVKAKGMDDLVLPLPELVGHGTPPLSSASSDGDSHLDFDPKSTLLCGDLVTSSRVSLLADHWFSTFLNLPSVQFRRLPVDSTSRHAHFDSLSTAQPNVPLPLRLSNESPFLLVTESSVRQVNDWISNSTTTTGEVHHSAFRPNLIVDDFELEEEGEIEPFWEDETEVVRIGDFVFANLGRCRRCLMVGINQETGERTKEPLSTLSKHRKSTKNGRVEFGVHMYWREDLAAPVEGKTRRVKVGDEISFRLKSRE